MKRPKRGWEAGYKAVKSQDPRAARYLDAAGVGDSAQVAELLDAGLDVDARDSIGWTALMRATRGRHLDVMRLLIARGARLDFENSFDYTALTIAAIESTPGRKRSPDRRPLDLLLDVGMSPTLHEAVYLDDLDLARRRLEEGDDPDTAEGCYQGPILMKAADDGNLPLVDLLLDFGANIEAMDDLGRRPLLSAAERGRSEVVGRLLERGADLDSREWSGQTALSGAAHGGHLGLAAWLIARGARRGLVDALILDDMPLLATLLDEVIRKRAEELAADPIEEDLDEEDPSTKWIRLSAVDRVNGSAGRLALRAAALGNAAAVGLLLDCGASTLLGGIDDHSLLAEAARFGRLDVIGLLLDRGADPHAVGEDGLTPLAWALREGQAGAAALLRRAGADR